MKVNPTELRQIIKEEAIRLKRRMVLESEKAEILNKLQELEGSEMIKEDSLEEIWPFSKKDPTIEREKYKKIILGHPSYKQTPGFVAKKYSEDINFVFEKLIDFVTSNGGLPSGGLAWDPTKKIFVDKTIYTGTAPGMQGAAE